MTLALSCVTELLVGAVQPIQNSESPEIPVVSTVKRVTIRLEYIVVQEIYNRLYMAKSN